MMNHMQIFQLDLLINLIIVVIYILWKLIAIFILHRKDASKGVFIRVFVMLVCPLAGAFYFCVSYFVFKIFLHKEVDLSDVVFGKERVKPHEQADEERSRNLAPLEEALAISDFDDQRIVMMNVLHGNVKESMTAVAGGLESSDTETAHYAASILQSELSKFRKNVEAQFTKIDAAEEEVRKQELRLVLLSYLNRFLEQHLLNPVEQKSYIDTTDHLADVIYESNPQSIPGGECEMIFLRLLEIKDYGPCEKWCERMKTLYPNMLATYTMRIKLYYTMGDSERFQQAMQELRSSDVVIDRETLEMIRAFM